MLTRVDRAEIRQEESLKPKKKKKQERGSLNVLVIQLALLCSFIMNNFDPKANLPTNFNINSVPYVTF